MSKENEFAVDVDELKKDINDASSEEVAYNLAEEDPTQIPYWISTGSTILDAIIAQGGIYGIPGGKIVGLSGLESTGKSFLAAIICRNAQQKGVMPVYFDSEHSAEKDFLERAGVNLDNFLYVQAKSCEFVLERVEDLIGDHKRMLFIWDSIAQTSVQANQEKGFDPRSDMPQKPKILSKGFKKLTIPLANSESTFITLNQLRDRITKPHESPTKQYTMPYMAPGGNAKNHAYDLRIWLTRRDADNAYVENKDGDVVGAEVKANIRKSKFGTENRNCHFDIRWYGEDVRILDEESWLDHIKHHDAINHSGAGWYTIEFEDGSEEKFRSTEWVDTLKSNEKIRDRAMQLIKEEVVQNYEKPKKED